MGLWIGLAGFALALWIAVSGVLTRRRMLARRRAEMIAGTFRELAPSLAAMRDFMPPLILFGVAIAGAQLVLTYAVVEAVRNLFTLWQYAGILAVLVAYSAHLILITNLPDAKKTAAALEAQGYSLGSASPDGIPDSVGAGSLAGGDSSH